MSQVATVLRPKFDVRVAAAVFNRNAGTGWFFSEPHGLGRSARVSRLRPASYYWPAVGDSKGFNERDAAKIPGPQGHVAASPLGAGGGKATREHRTRGRTQRSERQFPALRAPQLQNLLVMTKAHVP